jgi:hypothetical protein
MTNPPSDEEVQRRQEQIRSALAATEPSELDIAVLEADLNRRRARFRALGWSMGVLLPVLVWIFLYIPDPKTSLLLLAYLSLLTMFILTSFHKGITNREEQIAIARTRHRIQSRLAGVHGKTDNERHTGPDYFDRLVEKTLRIFQLTIGLSKFTLIRVLWCHSRWVLSV